MNGGFGIERVRYGPAPDQFVDLYRPDDRPRGTILSLHGGYWRSRYGLDLNEPMCAHLAARGWSVLNIEYRRIQPDDFGVWPVMRADIVAACSVEAASVAGPTIAIGHSAGGHLALWTAAHAPIDGVVALAPVADLGEADERGLSDHAVRELLGHPFDEVDESDASASPRHRLPLGCPQLVVHGRADEDVPFEMSQSYVGAAHLAGDTVALLDPFGVDHFDVIDPTHAVWRTIDDQLDRWLIEHSSS